MPIPRLELERIAIKSPSGFFSDDRWLSPFRLNEKPKRSGPVSTAQASFEPLVGRARECDEE